jgi:hypothetical protein
MHTHTLHFDISFEVKNEIHNQEKVKYISRERMKKHNSRKCHDNISMHLTLMILLQSVD